MQVNISWAFVGNAVYAACQWLVFVLLLRVLHLTDAGQFAYWTAITGPIFVLANLRLRNLLATHVSSLHDFADFLAARLLTTGVALGLALVLGLTLSNELGAFAVVAFVAGAKACDAVADICHGLFQRELDMRSAAVGLMTNGVLSVIFVALSLALSSSLATATAMYAAASFVTLMAWDLPRSRVHAKISLASADLFGAVRAAQRLLSQAAPLGLSSAVGSLQINLPRYVIATSLGPAALAVFTALAYIPTLGNLIANAIAQAALPVLATDLRSSRTVFVRRLRTLVQYGVALGTASVVATALIGRPVVSMIYGVQVAEHTDVLLLLMVAAAFSYAFLFLGTAATARMRFGAQLLISVGGLLTVGVCLIPLVGRYGLRGAGLALCAGAIVECGAYFWLTARDLRPHLPGDGVGRGMLAEVCGR